MYDLLAETFVYGLTLIYVILFVVIIQRWARGTIRSRQKTSRVKPSQSSRSRQLEI